MIDQRRMSPHRCTLPPTYSHNVCGLTNKRCSQSTIVTRFSWLNIELLLHIYT
jgi:hypothetical protein